MKRLIPAMTLACLLTVPAAAADEAAVPDASGQFQAATGAVGYYTSGAPMFGPDQPVSGAGAAIYTTAGNHTLNTSGLSTGAPIAIGDVEKMVRNNNLQVRALEQTIEAMEEQDVSEMVGALRASYQGLTASIAQMQQTAAQLPDGDVVKGLMQSNIMILSSQAQTMRSQMISIEDEYDDQLEKLEQTLKDTRDQLAFAAESTFLAVKSMEYSYDDLTRQRTTLQTTLKEMEKRYELGQVSALQLQETRNGLTQLESGIATLAMNIENTKGDLNLLLGREANERYSLAALPTITDQEVNAIDYDGEVKTVLNKSQEVRDADDAREDAEDQDSEYAEEAAQLRYESTVNTVSQNFQKLCRSVVDKHQLVAAAQSDYLLVQKNFQVQETKFRNGQISQNTYDAERAKVETASNAVTTAQNNLYTAYMKYRWAKKGIVSTN